MNRPWFCRPLVPLIRFVNAIKKVPGLEWLGEFEIEDIAPAYGFKDEKVPGKSPQRPTLPGHDGPACPAGIAESLSINGNMIQMSWFHEVLHHSSGLLPTSRTSGPGMQKTECADTGALGPLGGTESTTDRKSYPSKWNYGFEKPLAASN